ncbi:MAG: M23 family metallopeptidase [Oscillospiraceae bacterium]|nr:M23 family metallopeptidase [Oscillospiraceae bacterium]
MPTNTNISSHSGYRTNPITGKNELHGGTDFPAPHGTKVVSTADEIVEFSGWNNGGFGYLVVINHGEHLKSLYAHNSRLIVSKGEKVEQNTSNYYYFFFVIVIIIAIFFLTSRLFLEYNSILKEIKEYYKNLKLEKYDKNKQEYNPVSKMKNSLKKDFRKSKNQYKFEKLQRELSGEIEINFK